MAKKKKEKVVDLKPEKVTEEQLNKIQSAVERINQTHLQLGQMEARKHQMLHFLASTNDELGAIQNELTQEYGTFDVSIQDGTINYPENGEADKKD
jgi:hypothetical protein